MKSELQSKGVAIVCEGERVYEWFCVYSSSCAYEVAILTICLCGCMRVCSSLEESHFKHAHLYPHPRAPSPGELSAQEIESGGIIDNHYAAIASHAMKVDPADIKVSLRTGHGSYIHVGC